MINHKMELNCTALNFLHKIKKEDESTRRIESARIHVERKINHIKNFRAYYFITSCKAGLSTMINVVSVMIMLL